MRISTRDGPDGMHEKIVCVGRVKKKKTRILVLHVHGILVFKRLSLVIKFRKRVICFYIKSINKGNKTNNIYYKIKMITN